MCLFEIPNRELSYSKLTEKRPRPTQGVRLIEVSVKREMTVYEKKKQFHSFGAKVKAIVPLVMSSIYASPDILDKAVFR